LLVLRHERNTNKKCVVKTKKFVFALSLVLRKVTTGLYTVNVKKVNQSHYRSEVPRGFQEVKVPRLCDNGPGWW